MTDPNRAAVLYTDGSALDNPGPAGAGFLLYGDDGELITSASIPLGRATNNEAEYRALIAGLHEAAARHVKRVQVRSDSELLCRQLDGSYRVRSANLKPLHAWVRRLLDRFDSLTIEHVPRGQNAEADRLAQQAARQAKEAENGGER